MTTEFEHAGLDFTRDLCSAIERYTASAVKLNPIAYVYRGVQLRYAVERQLYIQCVNSVGLFHRYLASQGVEPKDTVTPALNSIENDIAHFLFEKDLLEGPPPKRVVRWLAGVARRALGRIPRLLSLDRKLSPETQGTDVLIHVVNLKFVRYLAPITRLLQPNSFVYLATAGSTLSEQLRSDGYPTVNSTIEHSIDEGIFYSQALSEFPQLMLDAGATLTALQALQPKCVVVVEGNAPMDALTADVCRLLGIPCYCVQQGWSPYIHNGFRNLDYTDMFVWGPRFAERLRSHNPRQRFSLTGNHAIGRCPPPLIARQIKGLSFFLQAPCALLSDSTYNVFVNLIASVAKSHPQVRIMVREHPSYPMPIEMRQKFESCTNVHFSIPEKESLLEIIAASDMVISIFSTVLLEALAMGVVPMFCSIGAIRNYEPDLVSAGAAIEAHSVPEALRIIHEVIAEPKRLMPIREAISKIADDFFCTGNAAEAIASRLTGSNRISHLLTPRISLPN
jgi:hypothetical protein